MDSSMQFHNSLNRLSQHSGYVVKEQDQLIVQNDFHHKKTTLKDVNLIVSFLFANKAYIKDTDISTINSISQRLIESSGDNKPLKNKIKLSFYTLMSNPNTSTQKLSKEETGKMPSAAAFETANSMYLKAASLESNDMNCVRSYYKLAADQGLASAQERYADISLSDKDPDIKTALQYYKLALDQGSTSAEKKYGILLKKCLSKTQDPQEIRNLLRLAANVGDGKAAEKCAQMSEKGLGGKKDLKEACECYKIAADTGSPSAQERYALFREAGIGSQQDFKTAFHYFKLAADKGLLESQERCGVLLETGKAGIQDPRKARVYYKQPAERGSALSQHRYGVLLINGKGGDKDVVLGREYLKSAADQGGYEAITDYIHLFMLDNKDNNENDNLITDYENMRSLKPEYKKISEKLNTFGL
jgi:TPR repeat protein